jgi:hypothetical protein
MYASANAFQEATSVIYIPILLLEIIMAHPKQECDTPFVTTGKGKRKVTGKPGDADYDAALDDAYGKALKTAEIICKMNSKCKAPEFESYDDIDFSDSTDDELRVTLKVSFQCPEQG